jgi:hypothetical protein
MSDHDEDDKPTVVLDLNALKKQKLKQEEDLAIMASTLEFSMGTDTAVDPTHTHPVGPLKAKVTIVLFDFQSDFFKQNLDTFPNGHHYIVVTTLAELNQHLKSKNFQIVVFNYDVNPKAVNQLCAQIKQKLPSTKTMIMARAISPDKAKLHAQTPSGASGYYQLPLDAQKIEKEILKIHSKVKKVG